MLTRISALARFTSDFASFLSALLAARRGTRRTNEMSPRTMCASARAAPLEMRRQRRHSREPSRLVLTVIIAVTCASSLCSVARGSGGGGAFKSIVSTANDMAGTVSGGVRRAYDASIASIEDVCVHKFGPAVVDSLSGVDVAAAASSAAYSVGAGAQYDAATGWTENAVSTMASAAVDLAQDVEKLAEMIIAFFKGLECKLDGKFFKDIASNLKMPGINELPKIIAGVGSSLGKGSVDAKTCKTLWNTMYGGEANAQMAAAVMKAAASGLKDKCPAVAKGGDSPAFTFGVILEGEVAAGAARGAGLEVGLGMDLHGEQFCFFAHCAWAGITLDTPSGSVAAGFQVTGYKSIASIPGTASYLELGIGLGNPPFPVDGEGGISYVYAGNKLDDIIGAGFTLSASAGGGGIMPATVSVAKGVCECPVCVTVDGRKCGEAEPALDTTKRAFTVLGGDRSGGDLHSTTNIAENDCINMCIKRSNCVGASYNPSERRCVLKGTNGLGKTSPSSYKFHPRIPAGFIVQADGDRGGGDIDVFHKFSVEQCAERCLVWSTCVGFTYESHSHKCITKGKHGLEGHYQINNHQYYQRIPSPKALFANSGLDLDGKDRGGGDRGHITTTLAECKAKCAEDAGCIGISYNLAKGSKGMPCYTKGTNGLAMQDSHNGHQFIHRLPNGFHVKHYGDRGGGDLFATNVPLAECADLCFARADCIGFSFQSSDRRCVAKGNNANAHYNHGSYQFYERVESSPSHYVDVQRHDRGGGDIGGWMHGTNPQACFAACQKNPKCFGVTYDLHRCVLKSTNANGWYTPGHWSFAYRVPNQFAIRGAGDRPGGEIRVTHGEIEACARACKEEPQCVGVSHCSKTLRCVLKRSDGLHQHYRNSLYQFYTREDGRLGSAASDASMAALGETPPSTAWALRAHARVVAAFACAFACAGVAAATRTYQRARVARREETYGSTRASI